MSSKSLEADLPVKDYEQYLIKTYGRLSHKRQEYLVKIHQLEETMNQYQKKIHEVQRSRILAAQIASKSQTQPQTLSDFGAQHGLTPREIEKALTLIQGQNK